MVAQLETFLHGSPVLCLFLSILFGTILGRFHIKGVGFGAVVGTLIAAIVIGIFAKPELPELVRWAFFYLFLFAIGYSVGPQFFGSLKKEALPQIMLAFVVARHGPGDGGRHRGALRLRRRHRRRAALGRHDAVGGARHGPQRDCGTADRRGDTGHTHGQRADGRRDHLRLRRPGPDPLSHVARTEADARGSEARGEGDRSEAVVERERRQPDRSGSDTASAPTRSRIRVVAGSTIEALEQRHAAARLSVQRVQRERRPAATRSHLDAEPRRSPGRVRAAAVRFRMPHATSGPSSTTLACCRCR